MQREMKKIPALDRYWARAPTGNEWLVEAVVSINHGANGTEKLYSFFGLHAEFLLLGIVPWIDPTPPDIKNTSTALAQALPTITKFVFDPSVTFTSVRQDSIDVGLWDTGSQKLLLATNLYGVTATHTFELPEDNTVHTSQILNSGGSLVVTGTKMVLSLDPLGTVGFIITNIETSQQS